MIENLENEVWREIKGYEGHYSVSNLGRVSANKPNRRKKILATSTHNGYPTVCLCVNNKKRTFYIHRLMGEAFIPKIEGKNIINHISGIKTDNWVENLEWCTSKENTAHSWKIGTARSHKGMEFKHSKLTDDDVREIRRLFINHGVMYIARLYGLAHHTIGRITRGQGWTHVK